MGDSFGSKSEKYLHILRSHVIHVFDPVKLCDFDWRKSQRKKKRKIKKLEPVSILCYSQHT